MKTLIIRSISALIAAAFVAGLFVFYREKGLQILCGIAVVLGIRELVRMLFHEKKYSFAIKAIFSICSFLIFCFAISDPKYSTLGFTCISIIFCCLSIIFEKNFADLTQLSVFQAKSLLGFFYIGLLPAMAYRVTEVANGVQWFLLLLILVFSGDTAAYLSGMMWGNKKILPNISPRKTIVGAIGGLLGSILGSVTFAYFYLPQMPPLFMALVGLSTGIVAQLGDLFESMLKRVANIKDSGTLMPGHGGVLDRIDGILFGAPIVLFWALFLN